MTDCVFCRRDDPDANVVVGENSTCFARLDRYPVAPGHCEIVPKRHIESLFDLTEIETVDLYALLRATRDLIDREQHPDGYTVGVNEGHAAGRTVDHLHMHLIPRYHGDVPDPRGGIRCVLPGPSPDLWKAAS